MIVDPGQSPGGEHVVSATPTRLQNGNTIVMSNVMLRSALGNNIIYIGMADMTTGAQRRVFILSGESVTLTWKNMSPNDVYIFGTDGDRIHWGSDQIWIGP
jgi:hypothetical protein